METVRNLLGAVFDSDARHQQYPVGPREYGTTSEKETPADAAPAGVLGPSEEGRSGPTASCGGPSCEWPSCRPPSSGGPSSSRPSCELPYSGSPPWLRCSNPRAVRLTSRLGERISALSQDLTAFWFASYRTPRRTT